MDTVVSIIIPVYNDALRLKLCLNALEQQSFPLADFEVLVVNNNSTDDIRAVVSNTKLNLVYLEEKKPGSYPARNLAIKHAKADILAFTDSDCIPDREWLQEGINCLRSEDNIGIVAGAIDLFYKSSVLSVTEVYEKYTAFHQEAGAARGYNTTANWFSYKSTILNAGCFEEQLKSNGDSILSNKIYQMGYLVKYCAAAKVNHPARNRFSEIVKKRKRIIGGRFDSLKIRGVNVAWGLVKACASFLLNNIKRSTKIFKTDKTEGFKYLMVVSGLFLSIVFESILLLLGKKSGR